MPQENVPVKVGILELLRGSSGVQFVIPAYQRNYTWTAKKEVKQLFDDLTAVLKNERSKHFVGIMIYLEKSVTPFHWERSVIDGQQRLTTIFLTLYAIKELMIENKEDMEAEKLENWYLTNPYNETCKYKLKPLVSDDEVYQHIVSRSFDSIPDRNSNVFRNFVYIKGQLKGLSQEYSLDQILTAINKLYIVCVPIGDNDYPQKIFESINATGSKLTASDLIRNFLLMPIVSDRQDEYYAKYWKHIEKLIDYDSKKLESFFRYFIMAKKKTIVSKNTVYQSFTRWYDEHIESMGIENIFKEIVDYAKWYNHLYKSPVTELEPVLHQSVHEFRMIISDMPAPLLIELYSIYMKTDDSGQRKISASQLSEVITILTSYLMRRSLCGMDTSDISTYFPELLRNILNFCNGNYTSIVDTFKRFLIEANRSNAKEMPTDNRVKEYIRHANMYRLREWVFILFRKMESENNPAPVDFSSLNIEHLMPQTPTALWMAHLKCDKETYEANVNRLGNLTLAAKPDNSRMGNQVWEYKTKVLSSTSHLKINESILEHDYWTLKQVEERTEALICEIIRLYPYYGSKEDNTLRMPIYLQDEETTASAYYYLKTKDIEIISGTMVKNQVEKDSISDFFNSIKAQLLEQGTLKEENGQTFFAENYLLKHKAGNDLSDALHFATMIIYSTFKNKDEYTWLTKDGMTIDELSELFPSAPAESVQSPSAPATPLPASVPENTGKGAILLQSKKVDWAFLNSAITLTNSARELFQSHKDWKMRKNDKRHIKIIINGEQYDSTVHLYNYDGRPNDVLQIRYPGKNSLIVHKLHDLLSDKYHDMKQKKVHESNGIEYNEKVSDRYVHIYMTEQPYVLEFRF